MAILSINPRCDYTIIKRMSGSKRPSRILFIDTETKTKQAKIASDGKIYWSGWDEYLYQDDFSVVELHRFSMGVTCFSEYRKGRGFVSNKWCSWSNSERLCRYIQHLAASGSTLYVVGHNIFFDLQASDIFYWFTKWGWVLSFYYNKALTYILTIRKGRVKIKFISSTNYFPYKLEVLGEFLGVPKLSIDFQKATPEEKFRYCRRDTLIVKKAVERYLQFIDKHELGNFSMSRSSQAFIAYRSRFMSNKIYTHNHDKVRKLERAAYFGGRVESAYLGKLPKDKYLLVDVNSMYPYLMKHRDCPVKLVDYQEQPDIDILSDVLQDCCVVAEVYLDTDEPVYAVRRKGKLIFPVGRFKAYLCTEGLKHAFEAGHLQWIEKLAMYSKAKLFTDYVDYFAKIRENYKKQNNKIMNTIAKDFHNHLYGKFAQMKPIIVEQEEISYTGYYREETYDLVSGETELITKMFNKKWIVYGREPATYNFTAIPAHVTEAARLYLYKLMKIVGLANFIYCDTDSMIIRAKHLTKLKDYLDDYKTGGIKIEDKFTHLVINGAKHYERGIKKKIKGIPEKAEYLGDYKYEYTQFLRQDSHLRMQVTRYFVTQPVIKTVKPYYDKGEVLKDGSIKRFILQEF
jgi:hypothetical protein